MGNCTCYTRLNITQQTCFYEAALSNKLAVHPKKDLSPGQICAILNIEKFKEAIVYELFPYQHSEFGWFQLVGKNIR